jgi:hypothetical protein
MKTQSPQTSASKQAEKQNALTNWLWACVVQGPKFLVSADAVRRSIKNTIKHTWTGLTWRWQRPALFFRRPI